MDAPLHDFTKPTRLSADWHHRLTAWCRVAWLLAGKTWAKQLTAPLEPTPQGMELAYPRPELARLGEDALGYRIKIGDRLVSLLVMPRTLMLNLVNSLLGDNTAAGDRELSLIEEKLADYFLVNQWLPFFRDTWPAGHAPSWVLEGREHNPSCTRIFADVDVLVVFHWQMRGPLGESKGVWLFPKKELLDALGGTGQQAIPEAQMAVRREAIVHRLPIHLEVVLGSAELRLSELSSLQVGDVVLLDQRAADGVLARAGGQELFRGQAGRVGAWKALQIDANLKK